MLLAVLHSEHYPKVSGREISESSHTMKAHLPLVHLLAQVYLCAAILLPPMRVSSSLTNHSLADLGSASTDISARDRFPYSIRVPDRDPDRPLWLHLGLVPNRPMSHFDIGGILALSNSTVHHWIDMVGENTLLPVLHGDTYPRFIEATEPHFVHFSLFALGGGHQDFNWGLVRDVIKALYLFLIEGRRYNAVIYKVSPQRFGARSKANGRLDWRGGSTMELS